MKKFLVVIGVLFLVFCGFIIYDTYALKKIPVLDIEKEKVSINKLYVYGTHLNMEGSYTFIDDAELVLYDSKFIVYNLNNLGAGSDDGSSLINSSDVSEVVRSFNLSDYINDGIYLDDIPIGDYYLFLRVKYIEEEEEKYRYYALDNNTGYEV